MGRACATPQPPTAGLLVEDLVFGYEVLNHVLLASMDPAGHGHDAEMKKNGAHFGRVYLPDPDRPELH